jgi:hypothetical protein
MKTEAVVGQTPTDVAEQAPEVQQRESVKVVGASFKLPERELDALRDVARRRSINVTQALRQAIALYVFLANQPERSRFVVEEPDGARREVVFHGV